MTAPKQNWPKKKKWTRYPWSGMAEAESASDEGKSWETNEGDVWKSEPRTKTTTARPRRRKRKRRQRRARRRPRRKKRQKKARRARGRRRRRQF